MKLAHILLAVALATGTSACGKKSDAETVPENAQGGAIGPFDLKASGESTTVTNTFSADISQDEGGVDYFVPSAPGVQYLVLESFVTQVKGCNANNVTVTPAWYANENSGSPQVLASGRTMLTQAGARGKLRILFRNMQGCHHLDFSMVVRKLEIGALQSTLDTRLIGSWHYGQAPARDISLFINTTEVGWLEGEGTRYLCDAYIHPQNSLETDGGWWVASGGAFLCRYRFNDGAASALKLTCYGSPPFGCSLAKNYQFERR